MLLRLPVNRSYLAGQQAGDSWEACTFPWKQCICALEGTRRCQSTPPPGLNTNYGRRGRTGELILLNTKNLNADESSLTQIPGIRVGPPMICSSLARAALIRRTRTTRGSWERRLELGGRGGWERGTWEAFCIRFSDDPEPRPPTDLSALKFTSYKNSDSSHARMRCFF